MLELNVDYFFNNRRDIFMQRRVIPSTAGYNEAPWVNYGKMQNRGVDASLTLHKAIGRIGTSTPSEPSPLHGTRSPNGMSLLSSIPTSTRRDIAMDNSSDWWLNASTQTRISTPRNQLLPQPSPAHSSVWTYSPVTSSMSTSTETASSTRTTTRPSVTANRPRSSTDSVNVRYKGLELGVRLQGTALTTRMINDVNFLPFARGMQKGNLYARVINDRWTEENPSQDVFFPRMRDYMDGHNYLPSTWWQKDMSFLRIKDIVLSYTLPQKTARKMGMSSMRIYGIVNNAWTFSRLQAVGSRAGNEQRYAISDHEDLQPRVELTF